MAGILTEPQRLWLKQVLGVQLGHAEPSPVVTPGVGTAPQDEHANASRFPLDKIGLAAKAWRTVSAHNATQLKMLKEAIVASYIGDEEFEPAEVDEVRARTDEMDALLEELDEGFADEIEGFVNLKSDDERLPRAEAIKVMIADYQKYLDTDPLPALVEKNEFHATDIRPLTARVLHSLAEALAV